MTLLDDIGFTEEQYRELHDRGMSDTEIAREELHCSPSTLSVWKKANGIVIQKPYRLFTLEEWTELRNQNWTHFQIAQHFGFECIDTYFYHARKIGVPRKRRREKVES
ncbi:hypothetical protein [Bacillus velezensis]|uniref:hypothetical protein n=1 Tax=Bacillus velezensis TaxID=492670 RepID=UPI002931AC64|nr:hypothetical protein [Bacillus velezensis]